MKPPGLSQGEVHLWLQRLQDFCAYYELLVWQSHLLVFYSMPGLQQGRVLLRVERQNPPPGGSESKTRASREIRGGIGEQREATREDLSEPIADASHSVQTAPALLQRKTPWKEPKGRQWDSSEVYRASLPNVRGEFILQGISR